MELEFRETRVSDIEDTFWVRARTRENHSQDRIVLPPLSEAVFQMFLALADGSRHGYAVMQEVEARTSGRVRLGPSTLYGSIRRLCEQGLLEEVDDEAASGRDDRRRHYRLTGFGREVAVLQAKRLERLLEMARRTHILPLEGAA